MLKHPEAHWSFFSECSININLMSVISTICENILKCTEVIEKLRLCVSNLSEELLYAHSAFLFGNKIG